MGEGVIGGRERALQQIGDGVPVTPHCGDVIGERAAGAGSEAEWREQVRLWKSIGITHLTLANYYESGHLHRIAGRSLGDHIAAMRRYWNAVADLL